MKISILVLCVASASAFTPIFSGRMDTSLSISSKELNQRKATIDQQHQRKLRLEADTARKSADEAKARHDSEENAIKEAQHQKDKIFAIEQTAALQAAADKASAAKRDAAAQASAEQAKLKAQQKAALQAAVDKASAAKRDAAAQASAEQAKLKAQQKFAEAKKIVNMDHDTLVAKHLQETAKPGHHWVKEIFKRNGSAAANKKMGDLERRAVEAKEMAEHARATHYATEAARDAAFEAKSQAAKILEEATFEDLKAIEDW
jgi:colicin import membrane protein